jgi:hypothetical protein
MTLTVELLVWGMVEMAREAIREARGE